MSIWPGPAHDLSRRQRARHAAHHSVGEAGGALFNVVTDEATAYCGSVLRTHRRRGDTGDNDAYLAAIDAPAAACWPRRTKGVLAPMRSGIVASTSRDRVGPPAQPDSTDTPLAFLRDIEHQRWRTCPARRSSRAPSCATVRRRSVCGSRRRPAGGHVERGSAAVGQRGPPVVARPATTGPSPGAPPEDQDENQKPEHPLGGVRPRASQRRGTPPATPTASNDAACQSIRPCRRRRRGHQMAARSPDPDRKAAQQTRGLWHRS